MKALISRLKEPSTYAGLAGVSLLALGVGPEEFKMYSGAAAGVFAFVAIVLGENS